MNWSPRRRERSRVAHEALLTELRRPQETDGGRPVGDRKSAPKASLARADLRGADLRYADLRQADLRGADLSGAQLDGADLTWARLSKANLEGVRFGRALLVETAMDGAHLTDADLRAVTGLTWATVREATGMKSAKWPNGFSSTKPDVAGPLLHFTPGSSD